MKSRRICKILKVNGTKYLRMNQVRFVADLSRPYHFKGCLPQISLGPFLNTLSHLLLKFYIFYMTHIHIKWRHEDPQIFWLCHMLFLITMYIISQNLRFHWQVFAERFEIRAKHRPNIFWIRFCIAIASLFLNQIAWYMSEIAKNMKFCQSEVILFSNGRFWPLLPHFPV